MVFRTLSIAGGPRFPTPLACALLLILAAPVGLPLQADSAPVYHTVKSGQTLGHLAIRYKTSVARLKKWNRLKSDQVRIGQRLKVGYRARKTSAKKAGGKSLYYRVRKGDTLSQIARRHRTSVAALRKLNRMGTRQVLQAGQRLVVGVRREGFTWKKTAAATRVQIPPGYSLTKPAKRVLRGKNYRVDLYARRFAQGHALYIEVLPGKTKAAFPRSFHAKFAGRDVPLTRTSFGYSGIAAISAFLKPGRHPLIISHRGPAQQLASAAAGLNASASAKRRLANTGASIGSSPTTKATNSTKPAGIHARTFQIHIADTKYRSHTRRVYLGDYDRPKPKVDPGVKAERARSRAEAQRLIKASTIKKTKTFRIRSHNQLTGRLSHPRSLHKITSPYNTKRIVLRWYRKGGKKHTEKPRSRYHHGLDLRGRWGDPIYSMANGTVVCARRMYYEGNFTMIDHGNGIFSGYMHQSKLHVREGQKVKAGQLIGKSGATGRTRGAHLHLNLWIRGVPVEPLSLLSLPIRN